MVFCGEGTFFKKNVPSPHPNLQETFHKRRNKMPEFIRNNPILSILIAYIAVISLISIIVCIYDKKISKKNRVELRTPEKTLLLLSALGGSVAMFITMLLIRHKTKHVKFMLGIPLIMIVQAAAVYLLFYFGIL